MSFYDYDETHADVDYDVVTPEQKKLDSAAYWVQSIMDRLYDAESELDEFSLQCDLDELCHILEIKPKCALVTPLKIQRKANPKNLMTGINDPRFLNILFGDVECKAKK